MHTTEVEIKAVAKAAGEALSRAGHKVPHSIMLHALAAALDKRDWHKLKAAVGGTHGAPAEAPVLPAVVTPEQQKQLTDAIGTLQVCASGFPLSAEGRQKAKEHVANLSALFQSLAAQLDEERIRHLQTGHTLMARAQDEWLDKLGLQERLNAAPKYLSDAEEHAIVQEAQKRYAQDNGGASITGHIVALTQEHFARANGWLPPQGVHTDSSVKELRELLRNVRSALETPGDLEADEVGHLLEDVNHQVRRLEASEPHIVIGGNAYRLVDGSLQSCAVLVDGRLSGQLDPNEWYEVSEDDEQTRAARLQLEAKPKGEAPAGEPAKAGDIIGSYLEVRNAITESIRGRLTPKVSAKFRTDDRVYELEIDATPYLAQCPTTTLTSIMWVHYSGAECTDHAAEYLLDRNMDAKLAEAFAYLHSLQKSPMKDPPGFEVTINREEFLRWMAEHHEGVLAQLLATEEGVLVRQLKDQDFEDNPNDWTWEVVRDGEIVEEAEQPLASMHDAYVDAYRKKGLLEDALANRL